MLPNVQCKSLCGSERTHKAAGLGCARNQIAASCAVWGDPNSIPPCTVGCTVGLRLLLWRGAGQARRSPTAAMQMPCGDASVGGELRGLWVTHFRLPLSADDSLATPLLGEHPPAQTLSVLIPFLSTSFVLLWGRS